MTGFTLAEVDYLLKALNTMSHYTIKERESIQPVDHSKLVNKLELYRYRISTWEQNYYLESIKQQRKQQEKKKLNQ